MILVIFSNSQMTAFHWGSWVRRMPAVYVLTAIVAIAVFSASLVPCINCTRADRRQCVMQTTGRCTFCQYDRVVSLVDNEAFGWALIVNGHPGLLLPNPADPYFPQQVLAFLGFIIPYLLLMAGVVLLATRLPLLVCSRCTNDARPELCPRCANTGQLSLFRLALNNHK